MKLYRIYWGHLQGRNICTFNLRGLDTLSVVLVAASEGDTADSTASPDRFVGAANIRVENIAPNYGKVSFVLNIDWEEPLPVWTDIVVFDTYPDGWDFSDRAKRELGIR